MFNFIDNYTFIPVSGCVGMGSSAHCFARGPKLLLSWPRVCGLARFRLAIYRQYRQV